MRGAEKRACRKWTKARRLELAPSFTKSPTLRVEEAMVASWLRSQCTACGACPKMGFTPFVALAEKVAEASI